MIMMTAAMMTIVIYVVNAERKHWHMTSLSDPSSSPINLTSKSNTSGIRLTLILLQHSVSQLHGHYHFETFTGRSRDSLQVRKQFYHLTQLSLVVNKLNKKMEISIIQKLFWSNINISIMLERYTELDQAWKCIRIYVTLLRNNVEADDMSKI